MKFFIKTVLFSLLLVAIISCGPMLRVIRVDVKNPSKGSIDLSNSDLSIFFAIKQGGREGSDLSELSNDSLLMYSLSEGVAQYLEDYSGLKEGSVSIYSYHPENDEVRDSSYYRSLFSQSSSSTVFILNDLQISDVRKVDGSDYYLSLIHIGGLLRDISGKEESIEKVDTVYWEILSRNDLRRDVFIPKAKESLAIYLKRAGAEIAEKYSGGWTQEQRYLYYFPNTVWDNATEYALKFKWKDASELWMGESISDNDQIAASAAFNMAVALEMSGSPDLALKWLDIAEGRYNLDKIREYRTKLKSKIERR